MNTSATRPESNTQDNLPVVLLEIVEQLVKELRPAKGRIADLSLDSTLDKDLGLDSLGRVELITRLEQKLNIVLPQHTFAEAETPRDLLREIIAVRDRGEALPVFEPIVFKTERVDILPDEAQTLVEVLSWHVEHHPDRLHIHLLGDDGEQGSLTYKQLWDGAIKAAAGLQDLDIEPGETVAIMLPTSLEYFYSFYAILLTGAIPVPIYPPARRSQLEDHLKRHQGILNNCQASILITVPEAKVIAQLLKSQVESLRSIVTVAEISGSNRDYVQPHIGPYDIAFLQYTSGSTGNPKGVVLTHANLLANIRCMGAAVEADSEDIFISWLPLYHDMGLIGAWLGSMYFAMTLVVMSPLTFLTRPQRWLWAMQHYRGTLSASPNFGYELLLKRINEQDIQELDLSHWRCAFNGAEPVSPNTVKDFTERFAKTGFKRETMMPVYGLAESSVGLAFPPLNLKTRIDCVQREHFSHTRHAKEASETDKNALCFVACGQPLPNHQVRVVGSDGNELEERHEGVLQFRGPSATSGYYRNPEETKKLFKGEWLDTGDLGYMADGYIYVTGRRKDMIIRAGRNIYPQELEEAVGNISGVRKGCVVTFGSIEAKTGTERLVLIAETRQFDDEFKNELEKKIVDVASELIGMPPDEIIISPPHTVLKTSSGKIRRAACRDAYERGQLEHTQDALWLQLVRTALRSVIPVWHRLRQKIGKTIYTIYAKTMFIVLGSICWLSVVLIPAMGLRWSVMRGFAKTLALLTGIKINVEGVENLPDVGMPSIYVANHMSYLDGMVMVAALPRMYRNVAKAELKQSVVTRLFLDKMGVEYVERFDKQRGVIDAQRIAEAARQKQSIFFYPEGTFQDIPGLLDFHMGAFLTAAQANIPVVPIALRGTRAILRGDKMLPRRGRISITIGKAISPEAITEKESKDDWQKAIYLRQQARQFILQYCGEPDIAKMDK